MTTNPRTIAVIGGLSAGPSAAARARRMDEHARILLFESTPHISYATCGIPYALSGIIPNRDKLLVVRPELLEKRFRIAMHLGEEVTQIDAAAHTLTTVKGIYRYDALVFAAGAKSIVPPLAGLEGAANVSSVRTLEDFDRLMDQGTGLAKAKHVAILGGGLIGVEVAENLIHLGKKVTLLEGGPQVLPPWDSPFGMLAQRALEKGGVDVRTSTLLKSVERKGGRITGLPLPDQSVLPTDYLILSVGIRPQTSLLTSQGAHALKNGALIVDKQMRTNLPDIYAAGDCATVPNPQTGEPEWLPLGTHSNKAGRVAGENAAGGRATYTGGYGTAIVKIFSTTLARTGMNGRKARERGLEVGEALITAGATPSYYPEAKSLSVNLIYQKEDGRLLGAEIAGDGGVDKRIDVLATAIYSKLTLEDLGNLDLAYAPPYSPAKDPVAVAAFAGENERSGQSTLVGALDLFRSLSGSLTPFVLDVRGTAERKKTGVIAGSTPVELDGLREKLGELSQHQGRPVVVTCAKGLRGHVAVRILRQNGYPEARNLAGGMDHWVALGLPTVAGF